jgi:hypothetical protein
LCALHFTFADLFADDEIIPAFLEKIYYMYCIYNLEGYVYDRIKKKPFFLFRRSREWKVQSKLVKGFPGTKVQLRRMGLGETAATVIQH